MVGREDLIRDIVRLRRAQRVRPDDDVAAVREHLERAAGPTVGRAAAARLLGLSQTALDRWIARGDIPVVLTPEGRREVPLHVLVELLEAIEERPGGGARPLAAVLRERRQRADRLDPRRLLPAEARRGGHRAAELRGLAYHRAVASRLDDRTIAEALERVRRWRADGRIHPRYADAWEDLLRGPRRRLVQVIGEDSDEAAALRQSSPLAGVLDEPTRRRVLELVAHAAR